MRIDEYTGAITDRVCEFEADVRIEFHESPDHVEVLASWYQDGREFKVRYGMHKDQLERSTVQSALLTANAILSDVLYERLRSVKRHDANARAAIRDTEDWMIKE